MTYIRPLNIRQHDLTHGPVALWQLNGSLADSSGNGLDLELDTTSWPLATERYVPINHRIKAFYFDGITALIRSPATAALRLLGDMTVMMLVTWYDQPPGFVPNDDAYLFSHRGPTPNVETDNFAFSLRGAGRSLAYFAEFGVGNNITYSTTDSVPQRWHHLGFVRENNDVTVSKDGQALATPSAGLAAPTGSTNGRFRLGAQTAPLSAYLGAMASVAVFDSALTQQQIADAYGRTIG